MKLTAVPLDSAFASDPEAARGQAKTIEKDLRLPLLLHERREGDLPAEWKLGTWHVILGLSFTDSQGRRWKRVTTTGTLTEVAQRSRRSGKDHQFTRPRCRRGSGVGRPWLRPCPAASPRRTRSRSGGRMRSNGRLSGGGGPVRVGRVVGRDGGVQGKRGSGLGTCASRVLRGAGPGAFARSRGFYCC